MSYTIISKFIKDISFEIPSAETFLLLEKEIQKYEVKINISSKQFKNNIIEVNTMLSLKPKEEVKRKILTEITLACLVSIDEIVKDKQALEKIILIKVPSETYSILYDTFIYLFAQAGINNISIEKEVDFEKLYNEKKKNQL